MRDSKLKNFVAGLHKIFSNSNKQRPRSLPPLDDAAKKVSETAHVTCIPLARRAWLVRSVLPAPAGRFLPLNNQRGGRNRETRLTVRARTYVKWRLRLAGRPGRGGVARKARSPCVRAQRRRGRPGTTYNFADD
jgi:hypothetical protein